MTYKTLEIEVDNITNLVSPSKLKGLKEPYVEVDYADHMLKGSPIKNCQSYAKVPVGIVFHFPYRKDENIVRFKVLDRDARDVGFADVGLAKHGLSPAITATEVKLGSASGNAGTLNAKWRLQDASDNIKPYMTMGSLTGVVPQRVVNRAVDDSDSSDDEEVFQSSGKKHNSLRVQVVRAFDLKPKSSSAAHVNPFVVATIGKKRVCGPKLEQTNLSPQMGTQFDLPYTNERYLRLTMYDRESMEVDRKIGVAKVDLKPMANSKDAEHAIESKLKKGMGGDKGILAVKLNFLQDKLSSPSSTLIPGSNVKTASIPRSVAATSPSAPSNATVTPSALYMSGDRAVDSDDSEDEGGALEGSHRYKTMEIQAVKAENISSHKRHGGEIDPFIRMKLDDGWLRTLPVENAGKNPQFTSTFYVPFNGKPKTRFEVCDDIAVFGSGKCADGTLDLAPIWPLVLAGERNIPVVVPLQSTDKKAKDVPKMYFNVTPHSTPEKARVVEAAKRTLKSAEPTPAKRVDNNAAVISREPATSPSKSSKTNAESSIRIYVEHADVKMQDGTTFSGTCECRVGDTELSTKIKKAKLPSFAPGSCFVFPHEGQRQAIITLNEKHGFRGYTPVGGVVVDIAAVHNSEQAMKWQLDLISKDNKKIGDLMITADKLAYVEKPYSFITHKQ